MEATENLEIDMPKKTTVCLTMIAKNEAHVIHRAIKSARPHIDYWVIVDTGSTDGTQERIRELLKDIPGELHERPWKNFAHNRNEVIELARGKAEYNLMLDADDVVVGALPNRLVHSHYALTVEDGGITYRRCHIFKNDLPFHYVGVLHEYIDCKAPGIAMAHLPSLKYRRYHEGARSKDLKATYLRDAAILEETLKTETDAFMKTRYAFYLAQSYKDAVEYEKAVEAYEARANMSGGVLEENYISLLYAANLKEKLGRSDDEIEKSYLRAYENRPSRIEAVHDLCVFLRSKGKFQKAYLYAKGVADKTSTDDILFVDQSIFDWRMKDELAVTAFYCGDKELSKKVCQELLDSGKLPMLQIPRIQNNLRLSSHDPKALIGCGMSAKAYPDIGTLAATNPAQGTDEFRVLERSRAWNEGWGTNVPLLAAVVASARPGGILEIGSGHHSTPVLVEMCRAMGRPLTVVENNATWADKVKDITEVTLVESWAKFREDYDGEFAVIFIDNQPDWERLPNLLWARGKAEFIVMHDTCNSYFQGVDDALDKFAYRHDYTNMTSCTSVVSDERSYTTHVSVEKSDYDKFVEKTLNDLRKAPQEQFTVDHVLTLPNLKREGLWLEFGCYTGTSIKKLAAGRGNARVYGFDSFDGLPEDWRPQDGLGKGAFALKEIPKAPEGATFVVGLFENTLPDFKFDAPVTLCHIDCDLYSSAKAALTAVMPYMGEGGVIIFDELTGYASFKDHEMKALYEIVTEFDFDYEWISAQGPLYRNSAALRLTRA
jgi:glycosyltransferase involved in cell wall biosynthesis